MGQRLCKKVRSHPGTFVNVVAAQVFEVLNVNLYG